MTGIVLGAGALLMLVLVVWAGHRTLTRGDRSGGGATADAMGNFIDVFDPARARADRDLRSKEHQGPVVPSPDDDHLPVRVDLTTGRARVRRPRPRP